MDYKKILKGIVDIINTTEKSDIGFANICTYIGENCPELKESDDERIRKELICFLETEIPQCNARDKYIAWLEKQGEQKPAIEMKTPEESLGIDSDTYNKIVDECIYGEQKPNKCMYSNDNYTDEERKVLCDGCDEDCKLKQKPADKDEPKFKVGQTIIYKGTDNIAPTKMTISDIAKGQYWDDNCCIVPISDQDNWELVEQKPAWSEEDETITSALSQLLKDCESENSWNCVYSNDREVFFVDIENWFKSLKDRVQSKNRWKPSDEQMKALNEALCHVDDDTAIQISMLIGKLKKL